MFGSLILKILFLGHFIILNLKPEFVSFDFEVVLSYSSNFTLKEMTD